MIEFLLLLMTGFAVGVYGALIGVGGGFILIPFLLYLYPQQNTELITSVSLSIVFVNAFSGSAVYGRLGRIDYKSGLIFSLATVPGAALGAFATPYLTRRLFDPIFGGLLIVVSIFLMARPAVKSAVRECSPRFRATVEREEKNGRRHVYSYNYLLGAGLSVLIGFFSSIFGVGGGIIHVPVLVYLLNFPAHIATATSLFILTATAGTATIVHMATGAFFQSLGQTLPLALGVFTGAPLGANLSSRIEDANLIRALSLALILVGVRNVLKAF